MVCTEVLLMVKRKQKNLLSFAAVMAKFKAAITPLRPVRGLQNGGGGGGVQQVCMLQKTRAWHPKQGRLRCPQNPTAGAERPPAPWKRLPPTFSAT